MFWDILMDTFLDGIKTLPFLFLAFLLVEWAEHHAGSFFQRVMMKSEGWGVALGALLGCVPQCGFSVLAANLYSAGIITVGTLIAVFASTSDEAVLILMMNPEKWHLILRLILCKVIIAVAAGFFIDLLSKKCFHWKKKEIKDFCGHCGCNSNHGILRPALNHTVRIFVYLFVITLVLNTIMEIGGEDFLQTLFLENSVFQPFLTSLVGLIPNCAASVIMAQLLMQGTIQFGSAVAGLVSGAGVGILVLFGTNKERKENWMLLGLLYATACISGLVLNFIFV